MVLASIAGLYERREHSWSPPASSRFSDVSTKSGIDQLRFMVARSEQKVENNRKVSAFLNDIQILPVDGVVADEYAKIKVAILSKYGPKEKSAQRKAKVEKFGFSDNDIWIAAIANCNSLTVVTEDGDFTRIGQATGLKVENWI